MMSTSHLSAPPTEGSLIEPAPGGLATRRALPAALWTVAAALAFVSAFLPGSVDAAVRPVTALAATSLAAGVTIGGRRDRRLGRRSAVISWALLCVSAYLVGSLLFGELRGADAGADAYAAGMLAVLLIGLGAVLAEMRARVREDAWEVGSDVVLVAGVIAGWVFVVLTGRDWSGDSMDHAALAATVGTAAALLFAAGSALALWWPSRARFLLFVATSILATAGAAAAFSGSFTAGGILPAVQILVLGGLGLFTGGVVAAPGWAARSNRHVERSEGLAVGATPRGTTSVEAAGPQVRAIRSILLVLALVGACAFLGVALVSRATSGTAEHTLLIVWVASLVGLRTLANQRAMTLTHRRLQSALRERQRAVESMQSAMVGLQESDQRLRGLLEAALDGVVEIGAGGVVVRANDAFRTMVGLPSDQLAGRTWTEVAAMTGADTEMLALRTTGHAVIEPDGRPVHLEARISRVPTDPPGTLMLVRDVTASKVAEQTIRTLFQFLQDRDEDRTRYMRRTNLAIEAERNKIARDLHDGPIQGVAAASLSLEAVRLMVKSGQHGRAEEMLASVREELREETENLRRLMSDLRPPLLEERGLVPAVKELCARFAESTGVAAHVQAMGTDVVPSEVDTVAYRVIQEALSNVKKHAHARSVTVRIEAAKGRLEVEVEDDGDGFDSSEAREYLRRGKVGLASMRERTELGSGTFTLRSRPGAGTTVLATLPLGSDPART